MSFGYSVGDFVAVTQLAWTVYKSCRDAPESFNNISIELLSLHAVLKGVEEIISEQPLSETRRQHLATISNGCQCVLQDLQALVKKYESLGSQRKRTWDRMKWGSNDIAELRARLTSNTVLLTAFMSTSQVVVEKKLNKLVQEFQDGQHEGTIKTVATVESLTLDDKQTWRTIRKELEDIGISIAAFDANKGFIMEWFQKAIATGAFEEQTQPAADDSESDNSESTSNPSSHDLQSYSEANVGPIQLHLPSETIPTVSPVSTAISQSSGETRRSKPMQGRRADPSQPNKRLARPQRSRLLSAVAYVLRYDRSFYDACSLGNYTSAKKLLERGANINAVSNQKLTALGRALANGDQKMAAWLLNNGADPNAHARYSPTPLHRAVSQGSTDVVALLLEHGADVEEKDIFSIFLGFAASPLLTAASQGHTEIARQLLAHGAKTNPSTVIQEEELDFPLHVALKAGHDETAQLLIESGSLNTMDEDLKRTLLLAAVTGSCQRSLEMLLERGDLNLEAKDNQGLTALDNAVRKDDLSMAGSLMSRGAIPHRPSLEEILRDPLHTLRQRRRLRLPKSGLVERTVAYSTVEGYKRLVNLMLGCDDSE